MFLVVLTTSIDSAPLARDRVARELRDYLQQRGAQVGEAVPSERILAKQFGVSRDTVRGALKDLIRQGLIVPSRARTRRSVNAGVGAASPGSADGAAMASLSVMSKTVALVADNVIAPHAYRTVPLGFEGHVFSSAAITLQEAGLHVLALQLQSLTADDVHGLAAQRLGGFILLGNVIESPTAKIILESAAAAGLPAVVYGDNPGLTEVDRCWSDHEAGAYALTKWLLARGKRRIQRFWRVAAMYPWVAARDAGFERAMHEAGITPLPAIMPAPLGLISDTPENLQHVSRLIAGYLLPAVMAPEPVDAFMVASDPHAYEVSSAIQLLGKSPADFPIVGYDDSWQSIPAREWAPAGPVATCDKDNAAIGRELATLLLSRMGSKLPREPQRRLVTPQLIEL